MASIEIPDVVKFEITVEEILKIIRLTLKRSKSGNVQSALRSMFIELEKGYSNLTRRVFEPMYEIDTEDRFQKRFTKLKARFKRMEIEAVGLLSEIHCSNVTEKLKELRESREWRRSFPWLRRSMARLDLLLDKWIEDDSVLYRADQAMMIEINSMIDEVDQIRQRNPRKAFTEFRRALKGVEPHVKNLNKLFLERKILLPNN